MVPTNSSSLMQIAQDLAPAARIETTVPVKKADTNLGAAFFHSRIRDRTKG